MSGRNGSPIRVLQVIAGLDPAVGGPTASAVATSLALRRSGLANSFAYTDGPERGAAANAARLGAAGIDTYRFPVTRTTGTVGVRWGLSVRLAAWLLRNARGFDVLHVHGAWTFTTAAGLAAARLRRRVAVLSSHESLTDFDREKCGPLHARIKQLLRWVYLRSFDVVVVASRLEQSEIGDHAGLRSVVIPHAVMDAPGEPRGLSVNGSGNLRVGFLGRLHPKKNLECLVDALALLPDDVVLHVAGDGPAAYRDSLVARAAARGVDGRIRWLGFVDPEAKRRFFESIDVLAAPSAFEGFCVAAAEALAAGLPVVVSSDVGVASVVREYGCGRVVAASAPELARALGELIEGPSVRRRLSENARRAAAGEFSIRAHGERLQSEYQTALGIAAHDRSAT